MTEQEARLRAGIARQQVIRALPSHDGAVTICDPRYEVIAEGLRALYLWNCRKKGSYRLAASAVPQLTVDPEVLLEAVIALHGPYAATIGGISKPDHDPGDWTMTFELPCDLRGRQFTFDAGSFVGQGHELDAGEWSDVDRELIKQIRTNHPELADWGDLAIGLAWGDYSQDILAVSWADWIKGHDTGFLAYLYISQSEPDFTWGGTGLHMDNVDAYGDTLPWETCAPLPSWASKQEK
ncbi:hypothetical protein R77560_04603 [Ralstonia thomasii]|uniref:Uncharacterized protein n=1 Tax=Ralstonia thomasii TaxID=3058596 RepID=A0AAD2C287_9RALS|nr:hypothetical protein [Ralstonia sp. LMG 18095]CAJ0807632.1 hypothetical protein R77560_04603 [Ralstonia sp. LMG 18095]